MKHVTPDIRKLAEQKFTKSTHFNEMWCSIWIKNMSFYLTFNTLFISCVKWYCKIIFKSLSNRIIMNFAKSKYHNIIKNYWLKWRYNGKKILSNCILTNSLQKYSSVDKVKHDIFSAKNNRATLCAKSLRQHFNLN